MADLSLPNLPNAPIWTIRPQSWEYTEQALHITAGPRSDLFTDPMGEVTIANSPRLLFTPDAQFTLSAHVTVDFASTYDACVLMLFVDNEHWAKLCFELSPQGEPTVVSVINNDVSDDCNSTALSRRDCFIRVTGLGKAFAFHYSEDGKYWRMVRYFSLRKTSPLAVGFSTQSPTGDGCHGVFTEIRYAPVAIQNLRSGE